MKIIFKKLWIRNFLSYGNGITELDLNKDAFTLILGENGSGKSSIIVDALHFALFGKIIRKGVKLEQVINNVNKSNCWVKLEMMVNGTQIIIERGLAPDILKLFKNGAQENERSAKKLIQQEIEAILQFDQNTFKSLSVLSLNNNKAFVDLTPEETRNVIESLLGLQVYSLMLEETKKLLKELKTKVESLTKDYTLYKELVAENARNKANAEQQKAEFERNKAAKIERIKGQINQLRGHTLCIHGEALAKIQHLAPTIPVYDTSNLIVDIASCKQGIEDYQSALLMKTNDNSMFRTKIASANKEIEKLKKQITFLNDTDVCPICASKLTSTHRKKELCRLQAEIDKQLEDIAFNTTELNTTERASAEIVNRQKEFRATLIKWERQLVEITEEIASAKEVYRVWEKECERHRATITESNNFIILYETQLREAEAEQMVAIKLNEEKIQDYAIKYETISLELTNCLDQMKYYELIKKLLSDSGIKSNVISRDIPFINTSINAYLKAFERNYQVEFDSEFNINIKGYSKTGLSYYNLSEGEKKRIDLAILLSFIDLSKKKNSVDLNILVLDEILDTSLDFSGKSHIINMLQNKINTGMIQNVFIISHDVNLNIDGSIVLRVKKEADFSKFELIYK